MITLFVQNLILSINRKKISAFRLSLNKLKSVSQTLGCIFLNNISPEDSFLNLVSPRESFLNLVSPRDSFFFILFHLVTLGNSLKAEKLKLMFEYFCFTL